jgi:hypothetical protein
MEVRPLGPPLWGLSLAVVTLGVVRHIPPSIIT